ncbi:MAG: TRAP transporter permease DctM/Q, partial [Hyphomicrobiales bacterium]|nr:TRAP transporter permease DctM/Q [Hyphomicrobiales bacterium]
MPARLIWAGLGAASVAFHIWLIFSGLVPNLISRPLHMALALPWVFIFMAKTRASRMTGAIFTVVGIVSCLYIARNEIALSDQYGSLEGAGQLWLAIALIVIVLEMARRAIGWPLPVIASLALAYGLFGNLLPGEFGHPGLPVESFLGTMVVAEGGLWGSLTGVSVNIVAVFVIMGAVLNA